MDRLKQIINSNKPKYQEFNIYSYKFSDGKIYVGYTIGDLEFRHNQHKRRGISPIFKYLNSEEPYEGPIHEKTVKLKKNDEVYPHIREIIDKYTTDTSKILNKNLWVYYQVHFRY